MAESSELLDFVARVVGEESMRVEETLGDGFVRLRVSEAERRQAKHDIRWVEDAVVEILRNARDAGATRIYLATSREGAERQITCIDNGHGIPESLQERVFEARVTSKLDTLTMDKWGVHGRGMALFSIRHNALETRVCRSGIDKGTALFARFDTSVLSEKADQSSWPRIGKDDEGRLGALRGPHNIIRTTVDFALECKGGVEVYLGSPTDIAATLMTHGKSLYDDSLANEADVLQTPVCASLSWASDALTLMNRAADVGLAISERTAYRIFRGDIEPLEPVASMALGQGRCPGEVDLLKDRRGLKVQPDDVEDFSQALQGAFDLLAERYYLGLKEKPRIKIGREAIVVTFEIDKS